MDNHWQRLGLLLDLVQQQLGRHFGPLSRPQRRLLAQLQDHLLSVGDLAMNLDISPAGVTQMLDKLSLRGYVDRVRLDNDQRMVRVRLTPSGLQALNEADAIFQQRLQSLAQQLNHHECAQLLQLLDKLANGLIPGSPDSLMPVDQATHVE